MYNLRCVKITNEQWDKMWPFIKERTKRYEHHYIFFNDVDEMLSSFKVVTLNGFPLKNTGVKSPRIDRIRSHTLVKLPDNKLAVLSCTKRDDLRRETDIEFSNNEVEIL